MKGSYQLNDMFMFKYTVDSYFPVHLKVVELREFVLVIQFYGYLIASCSACPKVHSGCIATPQLLQKVELVNTPVYGNRASA